MKTSVKALVVAFLVGLALVAAGCANSGKVDDPPETRSGAGGSDAAGGGAGSDGAGSGDVATLQDPSTSRATPTQAPPEDSGRPRRRLDMSPSDIKFLYAPYNKCMAEHGITGLDDSKGGQVIPGVAIPEDALEACISLQPLPAWEQDRNNPQAMDFAQKVLECLKGKGVKYVELYNGDASEAVGPVFGGRQHDEQSNVLGQKYLPVCTQEVYAAQHE